MSGSVTARGDVRRIALFVAIVGLLLPNAAATAQTTEFAATDPAAAIEQQPFGLELVRLADGGLVSKWRELQQRVESDMSAVLICGADPTGCTSPPALQFLALVEQARERDGLARFGEVNRAVNMTVHFASDISQHGLRDVWSSPLETIQTGNGDCEDYAILKLVALRMAGIKPDDLRLAILRNIASDEDHAVAVARIEGSWRVLDNQRLPMLKDWEMTGYRPAFLLDATSVYTYVDPNIAMTMRDKPSNRLATAAQEAPAQHADADTATPAGTRDHS